MKSFTLEIKTPEKSLLLDRVTGLQAQAVDGGLEVLAGHANLAAIMAPGRIKYRLESGEEKTLDGGPGFLIVEKGSAHLFIR
ncbi:MAG TPA: hypothetical protein VMT55_02145 [Candidatus Sulfotelmatobacter sp.]|nr:hypothetical protein [Candidatus Sulfotelmatobacter sp.]